MLISLLSFRRRPSLSKGLLAGAVSGLAGGLLKAAAEVLYPPRVEGQTSPPVLLVTRAARGSGGPPLSPRQQKLAEHSTHFAFSAAVGALYGALAEYWPEATAGQGCAFALVLLGATHESALPALGLTEPPERQPKQEQLSELATHLIFGFTVEQLRRRVRGWM
jgi:putative membrane protein